MNLDPADFVIVVVTLTVSVTLNAAMAWSWYRSSRRLRQLENRLLNLTPPEDRPEGRLESSIDALSAQVDQLASGQEFLNRVMAERLEKLKSQVPENTPH